MDTRGKRDSLILNPMMLVVLLLASWVSAGFVSLPPSLGEWIPAIISFTDISQMGTSLSKSIATMLLVINALSLYSIGLRSLSTGANKFLLPLIYLLFVLISPASLRFSGASAAAPIMLWSIYFSISPKQSDLHFFISGFLASLAALFEPSLALIILLVLLLAFSSRGVNIRSFITLLSSVILPFSFILTIRYVLFNDALLFAELYLNEFINISPLDFSINSFADIVLFAALIVVLISSLWYIAQKRGNYKINKSRAVNRFSLLLGAIVVVLVLFPDNTSSMAPVVAIPVSVVINEYLLNYEKSNKHKVQWAILLSLMLVARISEIIR